MRRVRRSQAGFTLIEILVALTVVALTILLTTHAFLTILAVTTRGGNLTVASALASQQLELLRSSVEGAPGRAAWRQAWCGIAQVGTRPFNPPYDQYSYRVLVDANAISAAPGQLETLLPCWGIGWKDTGRGCQPQYDPSSVAACSAKPPTQVDEDRMHWITVEVFRRSDSTSLARITSTIIRGAYHRPSDEL